jgi:predicted solute-binding protein
MLHGANRGECELSFRLPAECADAVAAGSADVGLVPAAEIFKQDLAYFPELGIASDGAVLSILLISQVPLRDIRTLSADSSSRTSVALARILLRDVYGVEPVLQRHVPELAGMLATADAALIIGDPALHLHNGVPAGPFVTDLGAEWTKLTGLPMVYALWAGKREWITPELGLLLAESYRFGRDHLEDVVQTEGISRGFRAETAREYLTARIRYQLDDRYLRGLALFREKLASLTP